MKTVRGRNETTEKRICETGRPTYETGSEREGVIDEQIGKSKEKEVIGERIGESEVENLVPE